MTISHPHEFETSMIEEKDLWTLVITGLLQKNIVKRKILGKESYPMFDVDQIIVFTHHLMHGFGMPAYRFFCGLLHYYQIKLVNLNPNSILHMPFSHLCEPYHGIPPFFTLS
jgi:hypothetical protein